MPMFRYHLEDDDEEEATLPVAETRVTAQPISFQLQSHAAGLRLKVSEESIRTELCDGPIPDSPKPRSPELDIPHATSDRADLIQRLKRGESPTWIPNRQIESLYRRSPTNSPRSTLVPPATLMKDGTNEQNEEVEAAERMREGMSIERPRSALHSGDFTQTESSREDGATKETNRGVEAENYSLDRHSWLATSPPRDFTPYDFERRIPFPETPGDYRSGLSSLSSSLSSSFVYKHPTSPLVQSESNDELDLSLPMTSFNIAATGSPTPRHPRRQTLGSYTSSPSVPPPAMRRDGTYPYQAHQPRRSLTSTPNLPLSGQSPPTPAFFRSRRPSYSSESSPMQHASMVGSYEESILRGRMSTNPSKPLDFMAQIGVLGLGKCKTSLKCPAHVTLPFSAVFYSYASTPHGRSKSDDGPSPYVGQIDIENGLTNPEEVLRARRKMQNRASERQPSEVDAEMTGVPSDISDLEARKVTKPKRRSGSPKAPPGGSYRIPEKGQIQIIIKNQNKTAVKLFLIPYDLAGMEPGTKTFIRQRSYSAGSIIENVPVANDPIADRVILRYLIHLHVCCPARGRYYLYKSIRVVFANRVPDGKEKLRNELTVPEPRFTPYKPIRVMHPPMAPSTGPGAILAAEKAFRRRSSGFTFGHHAPVFDPSKPMPSLDLLSSSHQGPSLSLAGNNMPVGAVPFSLASEGSEGGLDTSQILSPGSSRGSTSGGALPWDGSDIGKYDKLSKGDVGYGGNAFAKPDSSGSPAAAESLLSQRLRSLGMQGQQGRRETED